MVKEQRRDMEQLIDKAREIVDRLAEALDITLRGRPVKPAYVPARHPTTEQVRRHLRQRRGY